MAFIKNVRLKPVDNGFAVKYDYFEKGNGQFDSLNFINTRVVVFEGEKSSEEAISKVLELKHSDMNLDFKTAEGVKSSNTSGETLLPLRK